MPDSLRCPRVTDWKLTEVKLGALQSTQQSQGEQKSRKFAILHHLTLTTAPNVLLYPSVFHIGLYRGVAQPGSAFGSGPKSQGFKSPLPDQPSLALSGRATARHASEASEGCRAEAA